MSTVGLTDAPIEKIEHESLGMLDHVEALSEFIRNCETPITIACQGDWGTGKTSMMNMVCEKLKASQGTQNIETRWFNTWQFAQFQMQDEITLSLLSSFLEELGDSEVRKMLRGLGKLAFKRLSDIAKAAAELSTGTGDLLKDAIEGAITQDNATAVRQLRSKIQEAVAKLLNSKRADRIVVFIDDLDRLAPDRAVEILETIKLFLDIQKCVFVLAVDYHVVSKGLEKKFGVSMDDLKGKSFFDKIIQLPFNLPVAQYDIRRYMKTLFGNQFKFNEQDANLLVQLAENSIGANPRSLKRLFNTLQLLSIVARKKNMLDADAVATAEERYRLLFAVLCLQLAYPPVYELLLKEERKFSTEYFGALADIEHLPNDSPLRFETVKKALAGRGDLDEALTRFADFMRALADAAQLASDQSENADESLSQEELNLLRSFLSLSALTNAAGPGSTIPLGTFRHKAAMLEYLEKKLKPKHQASLTKMNTAFKVDFNEHYGQIGFDFNLHAFSFGLWTQWDDRNKRLESYLWNVDGSERKWIRHWFDSVKSALPALRFEHLGRSKYGYIESLPFDDSRTPEVEQQVLNDYFALLERTLDTVIPLLVKLYDEKQAVIARLVGFSDKLRDRLADDFPSKDGWVVENSLRNLNRYDTLRVSHADWNGLVNLTLEAGDPLATNFYLGVPNCSPKLVHDEMNREHVFQICKTDLFPTEEGKVNPPWWIYFHYLPGFLRYSAKGWPPNPDWRYAWESPEEESQVIEQIVERFARFKRILPELNRLAATAKMP